MTAPPLTPCACLGPRNGEPHCACTMVRLGLPRSPAHDSETRAAQRDIQRIFEGIYDRVGQLGSSALWGLSFP